MDSLKPEVARYLQLKEQIKTLTEQKKILERTITETMAKHDISTIELPNGQTLNYELKETINIKK